MNAFIQTFPGLNKLLGEISASHMAVTANATYHTPPSLHFNPTPMNTLPLRDAIWDALGGYYVYDSAAAGRCMVVCSFCGKPATCVTVSPRDFSLVDKATCGFHDGKQYSTTGPTPMHSSAPNAVPVHLIKTPVVPAVPDVCKEQYYGIECQCSKKHHMSGSRRS